MAKGKAVSEITTLKLKPSDTAHAVRHMIAVNLENARLRKKRRGLFMWGGPGISKSSLVEQIAQELNYKLIDIRLTQMEPTDLRGIPVPYDTKDGEGNPEVLVQWAIPQFFPKRDAGKRTATLKKGFMDLRGIPGEKEYFDGAIILLDELPNAAPSVQAGSYQLVLDGALGEYVVPDNVVVLAAGNRETDKGSTFKMPTPLMNRFVHVEVRADFDDWQTYALMAGFHKDVVGYLSAFKHEMYNFDPQSASRGFATPRSWEAVSDILRGDPNLPDMVNLALISGAIGDGIAVKFVEYRKNAAVLPNASDILDGKVTDLKNKEVSLMYSLTTALCYELRSRFEAKTLAGKGNKEASKLFDKSVDNFLGYMMKQFQPEMVIMGARTALATFKIKFDPSGMKNWGEFSDKYQELILGA